MKEENKHAGPCYYCNRVVRKGDGYMSLESHALWHDECVGSGRREGAHHYRSGNKDFFNAFCFGDGKGNEWHDDTDLDFAFDEDNFGEDDEDQGRSFSAQSVSKNDKCMKPFIHYIDEHATLTNEQLNQLKHKRSPMSNGNRNTNALLHESGEVSCFIVWSPGSNMPVVQTFDTLEDAWKVADEMARKNDGQKFIVAQTLGASCIEKPITRRTAMTVGAATKLPAAKKRAVKK